MITAIMLMFAFIGLVYSIRIPLVDEIHHKAIDIIFKKDNWHELVNVYMRHGVYKRNFLDLRKWTFNQMFPGLKDD